MCTHQEALLGKDPDFAEDFCTGQFSTDKILRERQRQEICGALSGSSAYFYLFMLKNVIEISLGILFIIANILIALNSKVCGRYIFLAFLSSISG